MTNISQQDAEKYYKTTKKREKLCWVVILVCGSLWGADIYLIPNFFEAGIIELCALLVVVSLYYFLFTKCPSCKKYGFRKPYCSACNFPLIEEKK